jgi:two-component SAPR family response regulator
MKYFGWLIGICCILFAVGVVFKACNMASKLADDAMNTAYDQVKVSALLKKYEWFKDASAQCDQKLATLHTYESRFQSIKDSYGADSLHRKVWSRDDREQWNVWQSEFLGVKASYNDLASTYNSAMSKINYSFCNRGELPKGADNPLPREFKPYLYE